MSGTRRALLDAVRRGSSAALVLRGDAGMGKTTLLEYALRSAADMRTVRLVGVQSDSGFGFGALHRLFIPFMDRIGSLPDRQRDAIGTAFGCRGRPAAGSVLVGLATLTVFSEVAAERALLCLGTTCNGSTGSPLTCWVSLHVDSCWRGCPDSTLRASTNIQGLAGDDCQFVDGFLRSGLSENRRPGFRCWVLSPPPNSIGGPVIGGRRFLVRGCMPR